MRWTGSRWIDGAGRFAKRPAPSRLRRDAAGNLRDAAGRQVPDAALSPRAAAAEKARRAATAQAPRERKRRPRASTARNPWWTPARMSRSIAGKLTADYPRWRALRDESTRGRRRDGALRIVGHWSGRGALRPRDSIAPDMLPRTLPLPPARADHMQGAVSARMVFWIVDDDESLDDMLRRRPDGEAWRAVLPLTTLSRRSILLQTPDAMGSVVRGYVTSVLAFRVIELEVYVRLR